MRIGLAILTGILLSGCSSSPGSPSAEGSQSTGPEAQPADQALANLTAEPPSWKIGQAWIWSVSTATTPAVEATTVVIADTGSTYEVGTVDRDEAAQAYPFHLIGFGTVDKGTMAWDAHGSPVQLLRFPLKDGDSWTADFWGAPGATVTVELTNVSTLNGDEPGATVRVTYAGGTTLFLDAEWSLVQGQFTRVSSWFGATQPYATAKLIGNGTTAAGMPFAATELFRGTASAAQPQTMAPATVQVPAGSTFILIACFFTFNGGPGTYGSVLTINNIPAGACNAGSTAPLPTGGSPSSHQFLAGEREAGSGTFELRAAGPGSITAELFAVRTS